MAHLTDGTLRRMVDDPDVSRADRAHLEECPDCRSRFKEIGDDAHSIATLLAVPEARVDVAAAFSRVNGAPAAAPRFGFRLPIASPRSRPVVLAFAAVIAALGLLATAIAVNQSNWTPTTIAPVPVTVADVQALTKLADYGSVTWTKQPSIQILANKADASAAAGGLQAPAVSHLPDGVSTNITYGAMSQAQAVFTFSATKAAAKAAEQGKSLPKLPQGLDGAQLTVTAGPALAEIFGTLKPPAANEQATQADLPQLVVAVSSAPTASSTQVTPKQMLDYLIAVPGISPDLKAALQAVGDPSTTLLIPIPVQYATSTTVNVQGVKGLALGDNTGLGSAVIWEKNHIVYVVAGTIKQSDALNIANNLK